MLALLGARPIFHISRIRVNVINRYTATLSCCLNNCENRHAKISQTQNCNRWSSHLIMPYVNFIYKLAGVLGVAQDDQSWNPLDGVIFWYRDKGLQKLWKCVTVKWTPCCRRKAPGLQDNADRCTLRGTASSVNGMYCSRSNRNGLLYSARNDTEVLWDTQCSLFFLQEPECEGLLGARP